MSMALHPTRREHERLLADPKLAEYAYEHIPEIGDDHAEEYAEIVALNAETGERHHSYGMSYGQYLQTDEWREYRQGVLARQGGVCALCPRDATHCHHRTYQNIGWEADGDCVGICADCHAKLHPRKRARTRR